MFLELVSALRSCAEHPIFTLFITTSMSSFQFPDDQLSRAGELPPITETDFGQLAIIKCHEGISLADVTKDRFICSLGRPLCVFALIPCACSH